MDTENTLTKAGARIASLNEVNELVPAILRAAGGALELLTDGSTGPPGKPREINLAGLSLAGRKTQYLDNVRNLYSGLRDLRERLEGETKALEDAGLIAKEPSRNADAEPETINTGLGKLDVGWLNSRGRDVAVAREVELLRDAKALLERANAASQADSSQG